MTKYDSSMGIFEDYEGCEGCRFDPDAEYEKAMERIRDDEYFDELKAEEEKRDAEQTRYNELLAIECSESMED